MQVRRVERGWAGHFVCSDRCKFRRNTLLTYGNTRIVVSTVGLLESFWKKSDRLYRGQFEKVGDGRYYETMAFYSNPKDTRYYDIDATRQVDFESPWSISTLDADDKANKMHERVVKEITRKLRGGAIKEISY